MSISLLGSVLGGVGLFLLGMRLMTDGLKYAAGNSLRNILEASTKTHFRGILAGAFLTSLVQSSSAVTVAAIGFVNAGLMNFAHAVAVIYGSNIGTTMTGWLVSVFGFHIDIKAFAVPAVGIGMLMRIFWGNKSRNAAFGDVLAGFGVFFIGIDILKHSFDGLGQSIHIGSFAGSGAAALVLFVGIGFVMTFLMQSSSASIAIILTALAGDIVSIHEAAATVIGANVGTTTTAALAVVGATPDAKRLACAHVFFNLLTGFVALLILPVMLKLLVSVEHLVQVEDSATTLLALFHTAFNVLGVVIMYPLTTVLVRFLQKCWRSVEEDEAVPRHLDKNVVDTAALALQSIIMELKRVSVIAQRMAKGAISAEVASSPRLEIDKRIINSLVLAIDDFANKVQRTNMPEEFDNMMPNALRVAGYYHSVAELASDVAMLTSEGEESIQDVPELNELVTRFRKNAIRLVSHALNDDPQYNTNACAKELADFKDEYQVLKLKLLQAGSKGQVSPPAMVRALDILARIRRIGEQMEKGARYLYDLGSARGFEEIGLDPIPESAK